MKRLNSGGRIDRNKPLSVSFNGVRLPAFEGDTLSSAMLAGGLSIVGRSFKYHRPRGIYSSGAEEPSAMVHLRDDHWHEPNVRATVTQAFDGLVCTSQNAWPSLHFDIGAVNDWLSPFFSAGFYYKTFIGPFKHSTKFWMMCETLIRRAAGMGRATYLCDPDRYEKRNAFCDVLIIGAGVAGLSAALAAGRAGAQVILVEQDFELGGMVLSDPIDHPSHDWVTSVKAELEALNNVRILIRTTVFGAYDGDTYGLIERVSDHLKAPMQNQVRQRFWLVHTHRSILATGAIERPLVFGGNDKPGIMLAGAVRAYLNRFAVLAGKNVVVATNNDSAYSVAADLTREGADVTLIDMRQSASSGADTIASAAGFSLLRGHGVIKAEGRKHITQAVVCKVDQHGKADGPAKRLPVDLIAVSGGWSPAIHLWSQRFGKPTYDVCSGGFIPISDENCSMQGAGTCVSAVSLDEVIAQGFAQGTTAAISAGYHADAREAPASFSTGPFWQLGLSPVWMTLNAQGKYQRKAFVDFEHDVKISDIDQAHLEGYESIEHLKRYTTLGMATDQGKLANMNGLAHMASLTGKNISEVGTTTFRPPFTPISIGAIVGHTHGRHFRPTRRSPIHHWHEANGAVLTEAGAWMRPLYYSQSGEDLKTAYVQEAKHVRSHVGMVDVSTLGKIAVQGPDAAEFLNRIYVNGWKTLSIGRLRYGIMLREDGIIMDDGVTVRLGEYDYFMSTTTANAAEVLAFAERLLQTAWSNLKVHVTSVTDQWAAIAVAGPKSRDLLTAVCGGVDFSPDALPNNYFTSATIDGVMTRVNRMSYSGELAYEIYIPSGFGRHVWEALYARRSDFNLVPYGTESMDTLRIEKGHISGAELDGRTTMKDVALEGFASSKKPFVGSVLSKRPVLEDPKRPSLVGLEMIGDVAAKAGSLIFLGNSEAKGHGDGWVSSATYSPAVEKNIAMGFLTGGKKRIGETVQVVNFLDNETLKAKVVSHHFFDPKGERQNG